MHHVSAQGIDEHLINVHYYYYINMYMYNNRLTSVLNTTVTTSYVFVCAFSKHSVKNHPEAAMCG